MRGPKTRERARVSIFSRRPLIRQYPRLYQRTTTSRALRLVKGAREEYYAGSITAGHRSNIAVIKRGVSTYFRFFFVVALDSRKHRPTHEATARALITGSIRRFAPSSDSRGAVEGAVTFIYGTGIRRGCSCEWWGTSSWGGLELGSREPAVPLGLGLAGSRQRWRVVAAAAAAEVEVDRGW